MKISPYPSTPAVFKASPRAAAHAYLACSLLVLHACVMTASAAVLAPMEAMPPAPAWSPKIKPGPKPFPRDDRRPKPPSQPCYPHPQACRGGF